MTIHLILGAPLEKEKLTVPLNQEDIYIGIDRGALMLLEHQYPLTIALGDFDSLTDEELKLVKQSAEKVVDKTSQDYTDFEWAINYIVDHFESQPIHVFNWSGGRIDHMINILWYAHRVSLPQLTLINQQNTVRFFNEGSYELTKESDKTYLSFITMTEVSKLTLEQVKYPLNNITLDKPYALISNEFLSDTMMFSFKSGLVMVIQSKD